MAGSPASPGAPAAAPNTGAGAAFRTAGALPGASVGVVGTSPLEFSALAVASTHCLALKVPFSVYVSEAAGLTNDKVVFEVYGKVCSPYTADAVQYTGSASFAIVPEMPHVRVICSVVAVWVILVHAILQAVSTSSFAVAPTPMMGNFALTVHSTPAVTFTPKVLVVVELIVLVLVCCSAFEKVQLRSFPVLLYCVAFCNIFD